MTQPDAIPFRTPRPGTRLPTGETTTIDAVARTMREMSLPTQGHLLKIAFDIAAAEARGETIQRLQVHIVTSVAVDEAKA